MIFYHSFGENYRGLTLIQTRRKLKKVGYTHGAQDEILHYLKQEKYIKDEQ
jgi:SOS response regulatory protein OraA/RecX